MIYAIAPDAVRVAANEAMAAAGYGPNNFNAGLVADGVVTHWLSAHHVDIYTPSGLPADVLIIEGDLSETLAALGVSPA